MPEAFAELSFVLVVADLQNAIFYAKCVGVVVPQFLVANLWNPAR